MPAKKKVTTDATKAKLPLPKGHPQRKPKARNTLKRVRCKSCEKMVSAEPNAVHTCYDAKALREDRHLHPEPSPISGQPLPDGLGSAPLDGTTITVTGVDWMLPNPVAADDYIIIPNAGSREPLYDTRPIPWAWDSLSIRRKVAGWLTTLAKRIAP